MGYSAIPAGPVITLDGQQLNRLLDGYDLAALRPHEPLFYKTFMYPDQALKLSLPSRFG